MRPCQYPLSGEPNFISYMGLVLEDILGWSFWGACLTGFKQIIAMRAQHILSLGFIKRSWSPSAFALLFFLGEGSPTKIDYTKKLEPLSNLSIGGPSCVVWVIGVKTHVPKQNFGGWCFLATEPTRPDSPMAITSFVTATTTPLARVLDWQPTGLMLGSYLFVVCVCVCVRLFQTVLYYTLGIHPLGIDPI